MNDEDGSENVVLRNSRIRREKNPSYHAYDSDSDTVEFELKETTNSS